MIRFQYMEYLAGLALLPFLLMLFWSLLRWKQDTVWKIGNENLIKSLIENYSPQKFFLKFLLILVALAIIIVGAANLQKPGTMANVNRKGVDVMIAMDVSKSMLAEDIKPNRLERARQMVYKLMEELQNDRIGLVLFAGRAYMQMPLTTDYGAARMYVQTAGPDVVPSQGTVIGEALRISNSAFNSKERKYKSIILITDGEDHDAEALTLSKQLAENGVMINCIGIGTPEGAMIRDPSTGEYKKDETGVTVISKLNEQELRQLAADTKGIYVRLDDAADAARLVSKQLDTIEQTALEDSAFKDYTSYFQWFLALALFLLIVEFLLPERKWRVA